MVRPLRSRPYTSWMMVRVKTSPAELPAACTRRPMINASGVGANPETALPRQKSAVPVSSTGRRPKRSASGPQINVITAMVANERLMSVCAAAMGMAKSRCTNGTAGVSIWVAIGPSP